MSIFFENNQVLFCNGDDSFFIPKQYTAIPYGVPRSTAQGTPMYVVDDEDDEVMTIEFDEENELIAMSRKKEIPASFPIPNRRRCELDDGIITIDFDEENEIITLSRRKENPTVQPTTTSYPIQKRKRYESGEEQANYDRVGKKIKVTPTFNESSDDDGGDDFEGVYMPPGDDFEGVYMPPAYVRGEYSDEEFNWIQSVVGVYDSDVNEMESPTSYSSSSYDSDSNCSTDSCEGCSHYYDSDSCELKSNDWDTDSECERDY